MTERHDLIAYIATLLTLITVFCTALYASGHGVNVTEAFGLGTITGGLIGVLRLPQQRRVEITNTDRNPVPTEEAP